MFRLVYKICGDGGVMSVGAARWRRREADDLLDGIELMHALLCWQPVGRQAQIVAGGWGSCGDKLSLKVWRLSSLFSSHCDARREKDGVTRAQRHVVKTEERRCGSNNVVQRTVERRQTVRTTTTLRSPPPLPNLQRSTAYPCYARWPEQLCHTGDAMERVSRPNLPPQNIDIWAKRIFDHGHYCLTQLTQP